MLIVKKDTSYRCIKSRSELFIEGKVYEASLDGCKRYTITSESGNSTSWYVLNNCPTSSQFEEVKENKMRKEFILGKKYKCTIGGVSFIRGEVYDTEQRKCQSFVNLVQPEPVTSDFSGYSWWCFNSYAFEEVEDDNIIKVGDVVAWSDITSVNRYDVIGVHLGKVWMVNKKTGTYNMPSLKTVKKVKDIRTIECAGGAVRITGEFVKELSNGNIQIKIPEKYYGGSYHWGKEVPTTPSQPH